MRKTLLPALALAFLPLAASAAPKKKAAKAEKVIKVPHEKFAALDLNHDGVLDKDEFAAFEKKVLETADKDGKKPDEKQAALIRSELEKEYAREDAKHDGKVTEEEFSK